MKHLDLFSGIGGFALATEMVWDNVEHIFCDNEPFAQAVLSKHWPNAQIYGDIRELTANSYFWESNARNVAESRKTPHTEFSSNDRDIYLLTGGFPCQPFSNAGVRRGTNDDRHLWPEMLRVIREFKPRWVIGENVAGLLSIENGMVFEQICLDLERENYEVWPFVIPACAVGAPHRRDRVWIVAHSLNDRQRGEERESNATPYRVSKEHREKDSSSREFKRAVGDGETLQHDTNPNNTRLQRSAETRNTSKSGEIAKQRLRINPDWGKNWFEVATKFCTLDDGLPNGLPRPRGWRNAALKGTGNAIVPQVAAEIMKAIKENDSMPPVYKGN